jgi:hypothetical protein
VGISKMQQAALTRMRAGGNSALDTTLDDEVCSYLISVIVSDLGLSSSFPELPSRPAAFFGKQPLKSLRLQKVDFIATFEKLLKLQSDADAYLACLGKLHKARLKYESILESQPIPTLDQVGPRSLLQFGSLSPNALAGLLFWRKWIFDLDNRAGQETGYLFEPIIAAAIGGVPFSAGKSPIKRRPEKGKASPGRRQVDCIRADDKRAYEFKLRVTIAASGQGRWGEEMTFPSDVKYSGYTPVLVVLDPTQNDKLTALASEFKRQGGEVYIGQGAWNHLEEQAGPTMSKFIERYVRKPMQAVLKDAPKPQALPDFLAKMEKDEILLKVGDEELRIRRCQSSELQTGTEPLPDDVDEEMST